MAVRPGAAAFRRVVVGFHNASGPASSLEAAARFARQLESELLGVFVEDERLMEWSASPLFRQLTGARLPAPEAPGRLAEDFASAAAVARRRLARAAAASGVHAAFRVERASAASLEFADAGPDDLLVVVEPTDPMARLSYPFAGVLRAVAASSAPVLYLPCRVLQRQGPVVAISQQADDPERRLAAEVATRFGERLINLRAGAEGERSVDPLDLPGIERALSGVRERLVVVSRPALPAGDPLLFATLAAERRVPTLVTGPGEKGGRRPD